MAVFKISQFGENLFWRYYWKKLGGGSIFFIFIWRLLILSKFNNSPISPNKSSPIIYHFTVLIFAKFINSPNKSSPIIYSFTIIRIN